MTRRDVLLRLVVAVVFAAAFLLTDWGEQLAPLTCTTPTPSHQGAPHGRVHDDRTQEVLPHAADHDDRAQGADQGGARRAGGPRVRRDRLGAAGDCLRPAGGVVGKRRRPQHNQEEGPSTGGRQNEGHDNRKARP